MFNEHHAKLLKLYKTSTALLVCLCHVFFFFYSFLFNRLLIAIVKVTTVFSFWTSICDRCESSQPACRHGPISKNTFVHLNSIPATKKKKWRMHVASNSNRIKIMAKWMTNKTKESERHDVALVSTNQQFHDKSTSMTIYKLITALWVLFKPCIPLQRKT